MYFVYLLKCRDGSLYTGITNNIARRLNQHKKGYGGNYTKSRGVEKILHMEEHPDKGTALKREAEIKRWPRAKKLALIARS